jgi:hypothetical protein
MAADDSETLAGIFACTRPGSAQRNGLTQGDREAIREFARFLKIGHEAQSAVLFPTADCLAATRGGAFSRYIDHMERGLALISNMPDMSVEDRINRAVALIRHNAAFRLDETSERADP